MIKEPLKILFATETGNAEGLAGRFYDKVQEAGWAASVQSVETVDPRELVAGGTLILFTSTWGTGEPPGSGLAFHDALLSEAMLPLPSLKYLVFGLGDSSYGEDFCACARRFDQRLGELGARRLLALAEADLDFEETFEDWCVRAIAVLEAGAMDA